MKKIFLQIIICMFTIVLAGGLFNYKPIPAAAADKTIKIGVMSALGFHIGLGVSRTVQTLADMDNKNGGVDIGGEKYKVEIVSYDSKFNMQAAMSGVNRLIFQDKVKFIVADPIMTGAWLHLTEENGVVVTAGGTIPQIFNKKFRYSFQTGLSTTNAPVVLAWFANKYPAKKIMYYVGPDSQPGRDYGEMWKKSWETFGGKCIVEYFPPATQDYSALATKVKKANPDVFSTLGGFNDQAVFKAVIDAGYKGTYLSFVPPQDMEAIIPLKSLEGVIYWQPCMIADPPPCKLGKSFKDAYIAKYGKWDLPITLFSTGYSAIIAAMQQTGSTDPKKVAEAMGKGIQFESTEGPVKMISRPDFGIDRTVDSIHPMDMIQIKNGKWLFLDTVSIEQGTKWFRQIYK